MKCPRDGTELVASDYKGIELDRCAACNGRWLDHHELDAIEATVARDEGHRRATIEYAKRPSELKCPVCDKPMRSFNYRAYNLELDTCEDEHGFWLDGGEDERVLEVMRERVQGLSRAASAEQRWGDLKRGGGSIWNKIGNIFRGGRR
jgi:Zn-finger nucleic acid-binding protein